MHIAEGILPASHAAVTMAVAAPAVVWSFRWSRVAAIGELSVYIADAAVLGAALSASTPFSCIFAMVLIGFAPVQLPLAVLEGLVSAFTLGYLAKRQAHLVPGWLYRLPSVAPLVVLLATLSASACGQAPRGADEAILDHIATQAGRPPTPWFEPGDERVLGLACAGSFVAGVIVTRLWQRLRSQSHKNRHEGPRV